MACIGCFNVELPGSAAQCGKVHAVVVAQSNTNAAAMPMQECVQAAQVFLEWLRKAETDSDDEASGDDESSGSDGSG